MKTLCLLTMLFAFFVINADAANLSVIQRNKQTIINYYKNRESKDFNFYKYYTKNEKLHLPGKVSNLKLSKNKLDRAFPDYHPKIYNLIAEGNQVFVHTESDITQKGTFLGFAPTNKKAHLIDFIVYHFNQQGKIYRADIMWNDLQVMEQFGFLIFPMHPVMK